MFKKVVILIILIIFVCQAFGMLHEATAQAVSKDTKKKPSAIAVFWEKFMKHTYLYSISMALIVTIFGIAMATVKKDKILKSLAGQLITIEQAGGDRYRGRLRVASEGIEVIAEKANEGTNEKVSYIMRNDEMSKIHALVRYHDLLTDREKHQRNDEVKRVYHPNIFMHLKRKTRNIINEIKRVAIDAFNLVFARSLRGKIAGAGGEYKQYATELEEKGREAVTLVTEAAYDSLVDRLIGTKVVLQTPKGEYVGVLKDYTSRFIELLDVDYKTNWSITTDRDKNYLEHDRGIILQRNGNNMILRSRSPFDIRLKNLAWREGPVDTARGDANTVLAVIPPFGQIEVSIVMPIVDRVLDPFDKLQLPIQYSVGNYKKIIFNFESIRTADIALLKGYGMVRNRTEKYEPKLLDITTLADVLLTSKEEGFILKGNPSATPMIIHNGHLTNLPRERMEVREVDDQISQRWAVDTFFEMLDKRIRPVSKYRYVGPFPLKKTRKILGMFALLSVIYSDVKRRRDPLLPMIYASICYASLRKRRRIYKNLMRRKRVLGFFKSRIKLPRLPRLFPRPGSAKIQT